MLRSRRMFRRLLPLLVALCTLVPADVLARFVETCQESDACCCRRDDERRGVQHGATVERTDCCVAPCEASASSAPALVPAREVGPLQPASDASISTTVAKGHDALVLPPRPRMRGPPGRIHARVAHWLV